MPADQSLSITLRSVRRSFRLSDGHEHVVLRDIDLTVRAGEIIALVGASGSGKSTLLRLVAGLDPVDDGAVELGGHPVTEVDQRCAVAFQEPRLLPWRSLTRNIELGLPRGTDRAVGRARVAELLELVKLPLAGSLRPRQVSGGMAQRASLARALARNPGVLLLDEPFGALDALTRLRMQDLLLDVHAAQPATILLVTHDVEEALYLADRVVLLRTVADGGAASDGGPLADAGPASIARIVDVPGDRPRDRAARDLAELRAELLDGLGVPTHHDR
jgi:sulfonate transport system ATP-binding protein